MGNILKSMKSRRKSEYLTGSSSFGSVVDDVHGPQTEGFGTVSPRISVQFSGGHVVPMKNAPTAG